MFLAGLELLFCIWDISRLIFVVFDYFVLFEVDPICWPKLFLVTVNTVNTVIFILVWSIL